MKLRINLSAVIFLCVISLSAMVSGVATAGLIAQTDPSALRIVSLNPAATELLFDFAVGEKIVGASEWSDFPAAAKSIPRVGSYLHPNFEQIAKLKPTLIIYSQEGENHSSAAIENLLATTTAQAIALSFHRLDDFPTTVHKLGQALHAEDREKKLINDWTSAWEKIKPNQNKTILILLDTQPLVAGGTDSFLSTAFERCGLHNILKSQPGYPRLAREAAWSLHPDMVLTIQHAADAKLPKLDWPKFTQVISITDERLGRLGLRLPAAVQDACVKVHVALAVRP